MDRSQLIKALEIIAEGSESSEKDVIDRLVRLGLEPGAANRLVALAPSALARPPLEQLGISFADVIAATTRDGQEIEIRLADQPEYVAALSLARDHFKHGVLKRETYESIASGSAEVDAASKAMNAGAEMEGSVMASALVGRIDPEHVIGLRRHRMRRLLQWLRELGRLR